MADKVKCDRCGGELEPIGTKNDLICVDCNLVQNGTGEPKAEVKGVELTEAEKEKVKLIFEKLLLIESGYAVLENIITARITALQTAHDKELAELLNEITVRMLERLPKQNPTENNLSTLTVIKLLAEITSAIEAIDKEALK